MCKRQRTTQGIMRNHYDTHQHQFSNANMEGFHRSEMYHKATKCLILTVKLNTLLCIFIDKIDKRPFWFLTPEDRISSLLCNEVVSIPHKKKSSVVNNPPGIWEILSTTLNTADCCNSLNFVSKMSDSRCLLGTEKMFLCINRW